MASPETESTAELTAKAALNEMDVTLSALLAIANTNSNFKPLRSLWLLTRLHKLCQQIKASTGEVLGISDPGPSQFISSLNQKPSPTRTSGSSDEDDDLQGWEVVQEDNSFICNDTELVKEFQVLLCFNSDFQSLGESIGNPEASQSSDFALTESLKQIHKVVLENEIHNQQIQPVPENEDLTTQLQIREKESQTAQQGMPIIRNQQIQPQAPPAPIPKDQMLVDPSQPLSSPHTPDEAQKIQNLNSNPQISELAALIRLQQKTRNADSSALTESNHQIYKLIRRNEDLTRQVQTVENKLRAAAAFELYGPKNTLFGEFQPKFISHGHGSLKIVDFDRIHIYGMTSLLDSLRSCLNLEILRLNHVEVSHFKHPSRAKLTFAERFIEFPNLTEFLYHRVDQAQTMVTSKFRRSKFRDMVLIAGQLKDLFKMQCDVDIIVGGQRLLKYSPKNGEFWSQLPFVDELLSYLPREDVLMKDIAISSGSPSLALGDHCELFRETSQIPRSLRKLILNNVSVDAVDSIWALLRRIKLWSGSGPDGSGLTHLQLCVQITEKNDHPIPVVISYPLNVFPEKTLSHLAISLSHLVYSPNMRFQLDTLFLYLTTLDQDILKKFAAIFDCKKVVVWCKCCPPSSSLSSVPEPDQDCQNPDPLKYCQCHPLLEQILQMKTVEWVWMSGFHRQGMRTRCGDGDPIKAAKAAECMKHAGSSSLNEDYKRNYSTVEKILTLAGVGEDNESFELTKVSCRDAEKWTGSYVTPTDCNNYLFKILKAKKFVAK